MRLFCITLIIIALLSTSVSSISVPGWLGANNQGGGIAVGDIDGINGSDIVILTMDHPDGGNKAYFRVGFNVKPDGSVSRWTDPVAISGWFGDETPAADVALADLNKNGRPDLIIFHIDNPDKANREWYRIGWDIDPSGTNVKWDSHLAIPVGIPGFVGEETQGGGIGVGDINRNGIPDLVVFHIDHADGGNVGYYKIGWDFTNTGDLTWDKSSNVDNPYRVEGGFGGESQGGDILVTDLNNNGIPDFVVVNIDHPDSGNIVYYRIGWDVSKEGVVSKWDKPQPILNFGDENDGCGIDQLEKTLGQSAKFVFLTIAPGPSSSNGRYPVFDPDQRGLVYDIIPITWGPSGNTGNTGSSSSPLISSPSADMELNTDLMGGDYTKMELDTPDPAICKEACQNDDKCVACTYVKPGVAGDKAMCWLKSTVPAATPNSNTISWVKGEGIRTTMPVCGPLKENIDMPGMDYKNFDLSNPSPCECMKECENDPSCKAFTYVKPGVQGDKARCWLKSGIPKEVPSTNCVSGVKT